MSVYERAETLLRCLLGPRRNRESCVRLGMWLLRQHGPYEGRVFPIPRVELAQDERFRRQCGLTSSQIRTATAALVDVGLLNRLSPERSERRHRDPPVQFEIGTEFATLFPQGHLATNRTPRVQDRAPLFVATWKNPIPQPVRPAPLKSERSLALAKLDNLKSMPLPKLSENILRSMKKSVDRPNGPG
jgi:hypothetical protein